MEKLYTVENIAQMTGLTSRTIRNYIADGRLRGRKIGSQWRFTDADIESLFSQRAATTEPTAAANDIITDFLSPHPRSILTACSMLDYPAPTADVAEVLHQMLDEHIQTFYPDGEIRFSYQYIEEVKVARFIFSGPADQVSKLVKIVRKKG